MQNIVFYIHIGFLCVAGLGVMYADHAAFHWLTHKRATISRRELLVGHHTVSVGLMGIILSGLYLFWPMRTFLLNQPLFWLKMTFVLALAVNSFFIERLMHTASRESWRDLTLKQRMPFLISGAVSTFSWLGAFGAALLLF